MSGQGQSKLKLSGNGNECKPLSMGHFANKEDLRRGFAAATVHDLFNMLSVAVFLPLNW